MASQAAQEASPRPLTGGVVLAAGSRVGVTVLGALTTVTLARVLGPRGWGTFAIAQSLVAILVVGTTLGVEHGIAYFVSSKRWDARAALVAALRLAAVAGSVGAAIAMFVRFLLPSAFSGLSLWLAALTLAGVPFAVARLFTYSLALATDRYELSMSVPVAHAALLLVLALPLSAMLGVKGAVIGMTTATVLIGAGAAVVFAKGTAGLIASEPGQLRRAISFGIKGYLANALQLINYRLDLFILAAVATQQDVGCYALAIAATSLLGLLPGALSDVLYPRVAHLSVHGDDASREMVETKSLRHVGILSVGSMAALAAALELLVVPVFGKHFAPTVNLALILLPGAGAIGASTILAATIVGRGKPEYSLRIALFTTPVTAVMYATLIPWLGATGAALASSGSYLLTFTLFSQAYCRVTGRRVLPLLIPSRAEFDDLLALRRGRVGRRKAER